MTETPPRPDSPRPSTRSRTPCSPAGRRPGWSRPSTGSRRSPSCSATRSAATRSIHLTGTNGKTSTSRMIDTLLRALDLRTGRFTRPHVERMSERISVDGEPLSDEEFVRAFNDVAPYTHLVDATRTHPLSFFETVVGMAYAAFADAPGRRGRRRGRHGRRLGRHQRRRRRGGGGAADRGRPRRLPRRHARRRSRSRRPGSSSPARSRCSPSSRPRSAEVLLRHAAEVGATVVREGLDFGVVSRVPAVGGQMVSLQGLRARYDDVFLPLYGAHQAAERRRRAGRGRGVRRRGAARRRPGARRPSPR